MDEKTVTTKDQLKNAAHCGYKTIYIIGELADQVANEVTKANNGNAASNVGIVVGLFWWPALAAGIVGKFATRDLKKYEIDQIEENKVTLRMKTKYAK